MARVKCFPGFLTVGDLGPRVGNLSEPWRVLGLGKIGSIGGF